MNDKRPPLIYTVKGKSDLIRKTISCNNEIHLFG